MTRGETRPYKKIDAHSGLPNPLHAYEYGLDRYAQTTVRDQLIGRLDTL